MKRFLIEKPIRKIPIIENITLILFGYLITILYMELDRPIYSKRIPSTPKEIQPISISLDLYLLYII